MDIRIFVKYFGLGGIAEVWIEYIETYKRITSVFYQKCMQKDHYSRVF